MSLVSEIKVIVRDFERKLECDHLSYQDLLISDEDPQLVSYIEDAIKQFGSDPDSITVKITVNIR